MPFNRPLSAPGSPVEEIEARLRSPLSAGLGRGLCKEAYRRGIEPGESFDLDKADPTECRRVRCRLRPRSTRHTIDLSVNDVILAAKGNMRDVSFVDSSRMAGE